MLAMNAIGCWSKTESEVIVYTALDREFSEPILDKFETQFGATVRAKFDVESTKTIGLVNQIICEHKRPRCDVFWNNEILHTLRLQKLGLLDKVVVPNARNYPKNYVSQDGQWFGFAARARVLIINTDLLQRRDEWPRSIRDLADKKWQGRARLAKPLYGTTATHAAVLFWKWGSEDAKEFFRQLKQNAEIRAGNKQVALDVADGRYAFGLTDTDDAIIELDNGKPVAIVAPDQGDGQLGTLFIPNTLCVIKGCPNQKNAQRLVEFLLSADVESQLAKGRSGQFPMNSQVTVKSRVQLDEPVRWMEVDFSAVVEQWDEAHEFLKAEFLTAQ